MKESKAKNINICLHDEDKEKIKEYLKKTGSKYSFSAFLVHCAIEKINKEESKGE